MSLRLVTLGGLHLIRDGSEFTGLNSRPMRAALLVAVGVDGELTRHEAAELLWPDRGEGRARHAMSQMLYQLRRDLGEDAVVTVGDLLRPGREVAVDAREFEEAVERERYGPALALYAGPFLQGVRLVESRPFEFWADQRRSRMERLHRRARRGLLESLGAAGDARSILTAARDWVELDPLEDEAHHALIEALAGAGKRAEALQHFDEYRRRLADELDVAPLDETEELVERIRAGDSEVLGRGDRRSSGSVERLSEAAVASDGRDGPDRGLAVLPFTNLSPDPSEEYLSDGITEELINTLARLEELHVPARTSSFAFKREPLDAREIGRRLAVRWLLEGSVRRVEGRLRISAQLIDASDGYHLWSARYDREMGDLFEIQEEIARAIVDSLPLALGVGSPGTLVRPGTSRHEAYRIYLLGRHHWNQRTPEALRAAVGAFERAVEEDPTYGRAYAGLADAYIAMAQFQYLPPMDVRSQVEEAVARALELEPDLAEAHTSWAHVLEIFHWDWRGAEDAYRRAIHLNPSHATARAWFADLLTALGRHEESREQMARAEALEPLSVPIRFQKGSQLYRAREQEAALAELRGVMEMVPHYFPAHAFAALSLVASGRPGQAVELLIPAARATGPNPVLHPVLAYALGLAGNREDAEPIVREMEAFGRKHYLSPLLRAVMHVGFGNRAAAFEHLEMAFGEQHGQLPFLAVDPIWDPVRHDARFGALLDRLGFPALERRSEARGKVRIRP